MQLARIAATTITAVAVAAALPTSASASDYASDEGSGTTTSSSTPAVGSWVSKASISGRQITTRASADAPCPFLSPSGSYDTSSLIYHGEKPTDPDGNARRVHTSQTFGADSGLGQQYQYLEGYDRYYLYSGCADSAGQSRYWVAVPANLVGRRDSVFLYRGGAGGTAFVREGSWSDGSVCAAWPVATWSSPEAKACVSLTPGTAP
ncbi:hypothetical protein K8W59_01240 [Nocardioides rotundus]|uniref:hypothetical protein n=1 Tax=Nocardioides rotundus TaxID=1774216 RepID=UPI001CBE9740|nr:hypothetical protein [Nocardioides rotundus]UAL30207.1 hypothetical protein K8W59_01240 [Nocardioides rotundus]